ncbi:MAG TPA: DNA gyrase inhibitor YacG [Polyangiaceae bacterium LLY-WYZ-14_1]|nr:DNA gyrase inhibitor YacG [Polyangiaceae bacterium LLY-WYZ-14_1]
MTKHGRCPTCDAEVRRPPRTTTSSSSTTGSVYPFCSQRCRVIDLGRWLDEGYRLPTRPDTAPGSLGATDDVDDSLLH